jgi:hypothetical protein
MVKFTRKQRMMKNIVNWKAEIMGASVLILILCSESIATYIVG